MWWHTFRTRPLHHPAARRSPRDSPLLLVPTYLSLLWPQAAPLLIIRPRRILRISRVLRLLTLLSEANELAGALPRPGHASEPQLKQYYFLLFQYITHLL